MFEMKRTDVMSKLERFILVVILITTSWKVLGNVKIMHVVIKKNFIIYVEELVVNLLLHM